MSNYFEDQSDASHHGMSYRLLRALKKGGFPQADKWAVDTPSDKYNHLIGGGYRVEVRNDTVGREVLYNPTLSELIEACGDKFLALSTYLEGGEQEKWRAVGMPYANEATFGATPEETVAKLWLKIHEQKDTSQKSD